SATRKLAELTSPRRSGDSLMMRKWSMFGVTIQPPLPFRMLEMTWAVTCFSVTQSIRTPISGTFEGSRRTDGVGLTLRGTRARGLGTRQVLAVVGLALPRSMRESASGDEVAR